jgi:hypothetical protein
MARMGSAFNPETCCEYTGLQLWKFPLANGTGYFEGVDSWKMGYWRADGVLRACRHMTPEEKAWIEANPVQYQAESASFNAWLAATRK